MREKVVEEYFLAMEEVVDGDAANKRLDVVVSGLVSDVSRQRLTLWIKAGYITLNNQRVKPSVKVSEGQRIALAIPKSAVTQSHSHHLGLPSTPQAMDLDILHSDEDYFILNKPAGLVVHQGAGNVRGTLVNGLLSLDPALASLPRCGLVHRLDKDTSGVILVARHLVALNFYQQAMQSRMIKRAYTALVHRPKVSRGSVDMPIGRNPRNRKVMTAFKNGHQPEYARTAVTHYEIRRELNESYSELLVHLETGRTHQIRVHMKAINAHVIGDAVYGRRIEIPFGADEELTLSLRNLNRQMLHAWKLSFNTRLGEQVEYIADHPADYLDIRQKLAALNFPASQSAKLGAGGDLNESEQGWEISHE